MKRYSKFLKVLLVINDIFCFYLAVFLLVLTRFKFDPDNLYLHFLNFSFILPFWLLIFYSYNFYQPFINIPKFFNRFFKALLGGIIVSIFFFYFNPFLKITPKTNLLIFLLYFTFLFLLTRQFWKKKFIDQEKIKLLIIAPNALKEKILKDLQNIYLFEVKGFLEKAPQDPGYFENVDLIVLSSKIDIKPSLNILIKKFGYKIPIMELIDFYEEYFGRIPLEEIDEYWILKEIINPENKIQIILKKGYKDGQNKYWYCFYWIIYP